MFFLQRIHAGRVYSSVEFLLAQKLNLCSATWFSLQTSPHAACTQHHSPLPLLAPLGMLRSHHSARRASPAPHQPAACPPAAAAEPEAMPHPRLPSPQAPAGAVARSVGTPNAVSAFLVPASCTATLSSHAPFKINQGHPAWTRPAQCSYSCSRPPHGRPGKACLRQLTQSAACKTAYASAAFALAM